VDLVTEVGNDNGGILLDIWHVARSGMDYETMVHEVPPEILFGVELNDAQNEIVGTLFEDTINCREYCGEGSLDVTAFIHAIDEIGFSGPWGVEIISNAHRALPGKEGLARALNTTTRCFELASST
jgi:sugar phosphate isomerase/epimerase